MASPFDTAWSVLKGWPETAPYARQGLEAIERGEGDFSQFIPVKVNPPPHWEGGGTYSGGVGHGRVMVPIGSPQHRLMDFRGEHLGHLFGKPYTRWPEERALERLKEHIASGRTTAFNPDAETYLHLPIGSKWSEGKWLGGELRAKNHGFDYSASDAKLEAEKQAERERQEQEALAASQVPNQASSDYWAAQGKSWDPDMGRWV